MRRKTVPGPPIVPRLRRLAALAVLGVGLVIGFTASSARAQSDTPATVDEFVPIIKVSGLIDPVLADYIGSDDAGLIGATAAPTIGQFLIDLPGFRTEIDNSGAQPTRKPVTPVVFSSLPLLSNQLHTVASPPVAYLLFLIGLGLLIFE